VLKKNKASAVKLKPTPQVIASGQTKKVIVLSMNLHTIINLNIRAVLKMISAVKGGHVHCLSFQHVHLLLHVLVRGHP